MPRGNNWRLTIIYFCSIGMILFVSVVNFFSFRAMNESTDRMTDQTFPMANTVGGLLLAAVNQETGLRGYMNSGDPTYLEPYKEGSGSVQYYSKLLLDGGLSNADIRPLVEDTLKSLRDLQAFFREEIELVENGDRQAAIDGSARGKLLMDDFRSRIGTLTLVVSSSMGAEWERQRDRANYSMEMIVAAVLVSLLAIFATGVMYRTTRKAQRTTAESEERYRRLVDSSPDAVAVHQNGRIAFANPACARLLGARRADELIGMAVMRFVPEDFARLVGERMRSAMEENDVETIDEKFVRLDGKVIDVEVTAIGIPFEGAPAVLIITREVGTRKEAERKVKEANELLLRLSVSDGLTGIPNRRAFDERLASGWEDSAETGSPFALALVDVDHFKAYNDYYGHQAGDACLQMVASLLDEEARKEGGEAFRYGGEEFAVLLPNRSPAEAFRFAESVRRAVESCAVPHLGVSAESIVTVSVGVASREGADVRDAGHWLRAADQALYVAKKRGRNGVASAETRIRAI